MKLKPSLAETHPELAAQADGWDPKTLIAGSGRKVSWKCESGHTWLATVAKRSGGRGCPICSGRVAWPGFNDLATLNPELAAQAHGWDPTTLTAGSGKKVAWKCESGHTWLATIANRSMGKGCPTCSNKTVLPGFNDLATTNPELAAEADGWDPTLFSNGSDKKVSWKCELDHQWDAQIYSRTSGTGCPVCSGRVVDRGVNDLATTNPELAAQANGWDPTTLLSGSNKKVSWKCESGHTWLATVAKRSGGRGCPYCGNQKVLAGFNDLATTNPELAAQANGWDPTTLISGSNKKVSWKCELKHVWITSLDKRLRGDRCPYCANKKVLAGFNDLATTNPELAAQANGWDPTSVFEHTNKKYQWQCDLGHSWKANVNSRSYGVGCPTCARTGFDPNKPGFLYFIDHFDLEMFQIGITNFPSDRLGEHNRRGWEVMELRGPMNGHLTQKLETDCLHALEKRGAILGHKAGIEKFDGYSEAWTKESLKVTSIKQLLDWVYEDDHTL